MSKEITENFDIQCDAAYKTAQIDKEGNIYFCCPFWINFYSIGNIKEQSFSEIWNGEKAKIFRHQFTENKFNICNTDICTISKPAPGFTYPPETEPVPKPEVFIFNYDSICNIRCKFCKDAHIKTESKFEYFEEHMDELLDDMLENVKTVVPSIAGEALFSPATVKLIKKITEKFPHIRFLITTNGLLLTKENLDILGITNKISHISVSLHAMTKKTYDKMIVNSDFDKIQQNLKFISELKRAGKIDDFQLNFVVNAWNYKEMTKFIKYANDMDATVRFLQVMKNEANESVFDYINIFDKNHPKYNELCEILKNPIFKTGNCIIPEGWFKIEPVKKSFIQTVKDKLKQY